MKTNLKNNTLKYVLLMLFYVFPAVSSAQLGGVKGLLTQFKSILNLLIPIIFGLSLVYFFWGTSQFILNAGDAKTREEGKQKMIWGVIALFVMVSIYGILAFVGSLVGIPVNVGGGQPVPEWIGDPVLPTNPHA